MPHFKAFGMMNLQYEIRICHKIHDKGTTSKGQHKLISQYPCTHRLWVQGYGDWSSLTFGRDANPIGIRA